MRVEQCDVAREDASHLNSGRVLHTDCILLPIWELMRVITLTCPTVASSARTLPFRAASQHVYTMMRLLM
jgi:hypothetical protein